MEEKMSRWGIGPVFASLSIGYGMMTLLVSRFFFPFFQIGFAPYWLMRVVGMALLAVGVPFFIGSVATVTRAYNADKLVTNGIFKCCRHPLYASWVVFIVPGMALLANSWLAMTAPIFMYFILLKLVQKEEIYLESVFGSDYLDYKKNVPCIVPYGLMKWKGRPART
jgi:protein-S-isoprenylcysteine O-methyltransferase Ste14